jgi:hypothetical protein
MEQVDEHRYGRDRSNGAQHQTEHGRALSADAAASFAELLLVPEAPLTRVPESYSHRLEVRKPNPTSGARDQD